MDSANVLDETEILKEQTEFYSDKISTLTTVFFGLSHNLINPLTAIQGKIQIFGMRHPEFKTEIDNLLNQCATMTNILEDITQKFRQEQNTNIRPIDINNMIENELRFVNLDLYVKHKIQKEFVPAENLPPVSAIYSDLSIIFNHILMNSIAAVNDSENKSITIATALDGEYVAVTIEDTGCGISDDDLQKIFMPFYSVNSYCCSDGGPRAGGRGLGLFIVYQLVQKYEGLVDMESSLGIGTKFTLRFPADKTGRHEQQGKSE